MESKTLTDIKEAIKKRLKGEFVPLFHEDGKPSGVGYSKSTKVVWKSEDELVSQYWKNNATKEEEKIIRDEERSEFEKREAAKEKERFNKAEKIKFSDFKGQNTLFFSESYGDGEEGYFSELENLFDSVIEGVGYQYDLWPTYIWATRKVPLISKKDQFEVYESDLEETFEDSHNHIDGIEDLQKALDEFVECNKDNCCYWPDYSTALLIDDQIEEFKKHHEN